MTTVMTSSAIGEERLPFGPGRAAPSPERQRWLDLARAYGAGLRACGLQTDELVRPEIYQTEIAHRLLGVSPGDWHLAIKPVAHLRPFHGVPNVFLCDAPPALPGDDAPWPGRAFEDALGVLGKADAVACCSAHAAGVLSAAGLHQVFVLPPYIASVPPPADAQAERRPGVALLAEADGAELGSPEGKARFADLLAGFARARGQDAQLRLTILARRGAAAAVAAGAAGVTVVEDDGGCFARLAAAADLYLSNHAHAGLSLPVLAATRAGLACVTPVSAEMAEFLPGECCVPILGEGGEGVADAILRAAAADRRMARAEIQAASGARLGKRAFDAGLQALTRHIAA